jgi:hypothetical protein
MQTFVQLLSGDATACYSLWADVVPALLFGALLGAAIILLWQRSVNKKMAATQEEQATAFLQREAFLQEQLKERDQRELQLKNELDHFHKMEVVKEVVEELVSLSDGSDHLEVEQIFYMPQPNRNGRFLQSGRHGDEEKAIYAFRPDIENPSFASFEFVARDIYLQVALGNEPTWINTACDRNNLPNSNTSQVKTLSPGQAVLHGDEWEITRKAQITYL